jgi:hypothetical protein
MKRLAWAAVAAFPLTLTGCAYLPVLNAGPPIPLQHPGTGQRVECEAPRVPMGAFNSNQDSALSLSARLQRECVDDFMRQGYVRVEAGK